MCEEEANRVMPDDPESFYKDCYQQKCVQTLESFKEVPKYEFDQSCQQPYAFDCKGMTFDENDKCFEVCLQPPEEAKATCESYCDGHTLRQGYETEAQDDEFYDQCYQSNCKSIAE